jgi:hypothetical protein
VTKDYLEWGSSSVDLARVIIMLGLYDIDDFNDMQRVSSILCACLCDLTCSTRDCGTWGISGASPRGLRSYVKIGDLRHHDHLLVTDLLLSIPEWGAGTLPLVEYRTKVR